MPMISAYSYQSKRFDNGAEAAVLEKGDGIEEDVQKILMKGMAAKRGLSKADTHKDRVEKEKEREKAIANLNYGQAELKRGQAQLAEDMIELARQKKVLDARAKDLHRVASKVANAERSNQKQVREMEKEIERLNSVSQELENSVENDDDFDNASVNSNVVGMRDFIEMGIEASLAGHNVATNASTDGKSKRKPRSKVERSADDEVTQMNNDVNQRDFEAAKSEVGEGFEDSGIQIGDNYSRFDNHLSAEGGRKDGRGSPINDFNLSNVLSLDNAHTNNMTNDAEDEARSIGSHHSIISIPHLTNKKLQPVVPEPAPIQSLNLQNVMMVFRPIQMHKSTDTEDLVVMRFPTSNLIAKGQRRPPSDSVIHNLSSSTAKEGILLQGEIESTIEAHAGGRSGSKSRPTMQLREPISDDLDSPRKELPIVEESGMGLTTRTYRHIPERNLYREVAESDNPLLLLYNEFHAQMPDVFKASLLDSASGANSLRVIPIVNKLFGSVLPGVEKIDTASHQILRDLSACEELASSFIVLIDTNEVPDELYRKSLIELYRLVSRFFFVYFIFYFRINFYYFSFFISIFFK